MSNKLKFKDELTEQRFEKMKLTTKWLAVEMHLWALQHGVTLVFTATWSTAEDDKKLGRISDTHRTGRAFDIRTKDLSPEFLEAFQTYFNTLYNEKMGAVTKQGPALIVYKPHGTGPHFHVQIRRDYGESKK
jgi:hypothetical protein